MSDKKSTILVVGGAGYIGSHAVLALKAAGYQVVIFDNLEYGHKELVDRVLDVELVVGDTRDTKALEQLFATHDIDAVMHFAAYIAVGESVTDPQMYYSNGNGFIAAIGDTTVNPSGSVFRSSISSEFSSWKDISPPSLYFTLSSTFNFLLYLS